LRRLRVAIPAHDEAKVIPEILHDLAASSHHADVWVIADSCTDDTAAVARDHGASVMERSGGGGKGAALDTYLEGHPLDDDEVLIVFDADNRVPPQVLARISDEIDAGHRVVQCYLDVSNPDDSALAMASAMSYWAGNRMVQLARTNLGWSADLGGTGMAFAPEALRAAGAFTASLTEDQDLGARLALAGERVVWLHDVRIFDEKPPALGATVRQRARWMAGRRGVARRHAWPLARRGVATRSFALIDQAIRLMQPGRSFVALVSGTLTLTAALTGSRWLLPWELWAVATAVQVAEPIPFLARDRVPARYLVRYPLLVLLAALWAPIRLLSTRVTSWQRTPHRPVVSRPPPDP
jgi:cellulose synthase/poly-beta-1,6-N-acetylglucosamine synthase-like glycosyltransferase